MAVNIYAFWFIDAAEKKYFYVGRSKDVTRRMREHHYRKRKGPEDKYEWIRELEAAGIPWFFETVDTVPNGEYFPDVERWHVIRLTREGHELRNMRHGSVEHRKELAEQVSSPRIRSAKEVGFDRRRRNFKTSKMLKRKIWLCDLKHRGILDIQSYKVLPTVFQRKLKARNEADGSQLLFSRALPLDRFLKILRKPLSDTQEFRRFRESIKFLK